MTILETTDANAGGAKEPIKFPGTKEERREERMRRRLERNKTAEAEGRSVPIPFLDPDEVTRPAVEPAAEGKQKERRGAAIKRHFQLSWTLVSFLLMVAFPGGLATFYYLVIASPQYVIETQFSVRGASQSSMSSFGLSGLFGSSVQSGDSYIVSSYIESVQLIRDVKDQLGIDLRQYFAKNDIDFYYRIKADMPLEKFTSYWRDMIEVSFNSTTGNTTLYIYGFSADDAKAIADAVLKVSETLVNNLSESNRQQMTLMASKQVDRSEDRLRKVRQEISKLRSDEKTLDPTILSQREAQLTQQLETQLQNLKTRQATLLQSVSKDSPSARMLQKQIKSAEEALVSQKDKISFDVGKGARKDGADRNVAEVLNRFEELTVEQGFATQAYTTALAAFETALAEAQKQERYFATFIAPTRPEIALYPMRWLDSLISVLVLLAIWMISQFLYRSFRDHAI
jgi:capsular polysaccharide transport system permease protein